MPSTRTIAFRNTSLLDFVLQTPVLMSIGGSKAWNIESVPPMPDPERTSVDDLIGYIRVELQPIVLSSSGTLTINGFRYTIVPRTIEAITTQNCNQVVAIADLDHSLLTQGSFRSVGIHRILNFASGVTINNRVLFKPQDVVSHQCLALANRLPSIKQADIEERIYQFFYF